MIFARLRRLFRRGRVHQLATRYREGRAFFDRCPACTCSYLRAPIRTPHHKPCPTCGAALDSIGAIGIDQAVAIIAAARGSNQPGARR